MADKCQQPGCQGAIDDGFCDTCATEAGTPAAVNSGSKRSVSSRSSALSASASSALGSSQHADSSTRSRSRRTGSRSTRSRTHLGCGVMKVPDLPPIDPSKVGMAKAVVPPDKRFCSKCDSPLVPERDACSTCTVPFAPNANGCCNPRGAGAGGCSNFGKPNNCPGCGNALRPGKKLCGHCRRPQNAERGTCPNAKCGKSYDFVPKLKSGDIVAQQYKIHGPLAFGGLGWLYFGDDETLKRRVALKGLLNSGDEEAAQAAAEEMAWLARFDHPNILKVYSAVTQDRTEENPGEAPRQVKDAYIVMEYIPGRTLKQLVKERGPLPVDEAIAYLLPILEALGYLHDEGALYNDLKPDNIMLKGDELGKNPNSILIDLGAVRQVSQAGGGVYHTPGFSAPEISSRDPDKHARPSFASDIFTAGRTLVALIMNFDIGGRYLYTLPAPTSVEGSVLAEHPSLHRWLLKCTRENPDERFQDAREAAEQLKLILLELAAEKGVSSAIESTLFTGDVMAVRQHGTCNGITLASGELLPDLRMILEDPAAQYILSNGAVSDPHKQEVVFQEAVTKFDRSVEALLRLAHTRIRLGKYAEAGQALERVLALDPFEVRVLWYRGVNLLQQGKAREALQEFNGLWGELPGEPAVKLALAVAAELAGETEDAIRLYDLISREDPQFVLASFGLGRCQSKSGKRSEAVAAYNRVPTAHSLYEKAQAASARALLQSVSQEPGRQELLDASRTIEALTVQGLERLDLMEEVLSRSLMLVESGLVQSDSGAQVLGNALTSRALRFGLFDLYRSKAKLVQDRSDKIALIDKAYGVQPRRLVAWF